MRAGPPGVRASRTRDAARNRPRDGTRPRDKRRGWRGWLTLLVLVVVVGLASIGPTQLHELITGVTFVPPPAATLPAPTSHVDPGLQSRLETVARDLPQGRLALTAVDLGNGATATVDASRGYLAASLFKLPILMEVLDEEQRGELDPTRKVQITQDDWTDGSGVLQARVGDWLSIGELTQLMIEQSDNIAALVLLDAVGVPRTNAIAQRLGLADTHVVDHRAGESGDHTTTARDMAQLLVALATGQAINQHVSEQALSLLGHKQSVTWLGDDLPFWVKVAHKWGDLPNARNDAGIISTPRGTYVIAVLTEDSPPDAAASAIARASRVTYDYLGNR